MSANLDRLIELIKQLLPFIAGWLSAQSREAKKDAKIMQQQRDVKPFSSYDDVRDWVRGERKK